MSRYFITRGTTSAVLARATNPVPAGAVEFVGDYATKDGLQTLMIWDAGINNIRRMTRAEENTAYDPTLENRRSAKTVVADQTSPTAMAARAYAIAVQKDRNGTRTERQLVADAQAIIDAGGVG